MRAAVARGGRIVAAEISDPVPGPGDALVEVQACGICGSDLHTLAHGDTMRELAEDMGAPSALDPDADYVMGHEFSAEVLELGPETDGAPVAPGDLVVSMPARITGSGFVAIGFDNDTNGAYAEQMLLTAAICMKVPNGLDARRAALTEPMAVGLHAVNKSGIGERDGAIVHGCGPLGLAAIGALTARGIGPIVASDFSPRRRALAEHFGAHEIVDPAEEAAIEVWERVGGAKRAVVFEAVGVPGMLDRIIRDVPPQSRICIIGACMEADTVFPIVALAKELSLQFVIAYDPVEFAQTLQAIADGELDVEPMITDTVGIDGVAGAFEALGHPDDQVKVLVEP